MVLNLIMETEVVLSRLIFFIAIPGLISNVIAFLILNRKDMRSSYNFILKGMFFMSFHILSNAFKWVEC